MNSFKSLSSAQLALLAKKLRQETSLLASEPIAVIGMSCRFPGGANSPAEYWNLLINGLDAVGLVPAERWRSSEYYDPNPEAPNKTYSRHGGFLNYDVAEFDAAYFGITPREANYLDPQHRLMLEIACEAFSDARLSYSGLQGSNTGVFVGISGMDYLHCTAEGPHIEAYSGTGNAHSAAAGRISYTFGLQGPCLALDTACSSSLVAVHLACTSLRTLECDMALAGGVNLLLSPTTTVGFSKARMLSATGRCRSFDAGADGYVRGEGCGSLVLKRLSDALANGDRILAVIRGSAVNQDGRTIGLTVPNGPRQQHVIRKALEFVDPTSIDYVEAHGTGTSLGDPIEIHALRDVFGTERETPLFVGSAKSNIGHLEAAAGMAGIIKAVLSFQNECIPPNLHFNVLNPNIMLNGSPLVFPTKAIAWPRTSTRRRRAGVSSFGFSGTNSHIVLEEADVIETTPTALDAPAETLPISCNFQRKHFWIPKVSGFSFRARQINVHPMLSKRIVQPNGDVVFEAHIEGEGQNELSFLGDHRVFGKAIIPMACYIEMIIAGAAMGLSLKGMDLENITVTQPIVLDPDGSKTIQCVIRSTGDPGLFNVSIVSGIEGSALSHCTAQIRDIAERSLPRSPELSHGSLLDDWEEEAFYYQLRRMGLEYGPAFRKVRRLRTGASISLSSLSECHNVAEGFYIDPRLLDGALQTIAGALQTSEILLPTTIRRVRVSSDLAKDPDAAFCRIAGRAGGDEANAVVDVFVTSAGETMMMLEGIELRPYPQALFDAKGGAQQQAQTYRLEWKPIEIPETMMPLQCLIITDDAAVHADICNQSGLTDEQLGLASANDAERIRSFLRDGGGTILLPIDWKSSFDPSADLHFVNEAILNCAETILKVTDYCGDQLAVRLIFVTCGAQDPIDISCDSPVASVVSGLARSISLERPSLQVSCIDLGSSPLPSEIRQLISIVAAGLAENHVILRSGQCYVGRLKEMAPAPQEPNRILSPNINGLIDHMVWRTAERNRPAPGEVEIRVSMSGLNFRDVLCAMGLYPGFSGPLGGEFSGTVTRVGSNSSQLLVGQRVLGIGFGAFGDYVTTHENLVATIGEKVSELSAASLPIAWLTAWWGLMELAELKKGQRVLIHSAAGGVGITAVQLALRAGAEVWATVSTPTKVAKLRELGVRHIFSSRDTSFAARIMEHTSNAGVDVVLNSLAGEFIEASFSALSKGGYFLEIGKNGVWTHEEVKASRPDVRYSCYDVAEICARRPSKVNGLLKSMVCELETELLVPPPCQEFSIDQAGEAFRLMTKGQHIGKIVFRHKQDTPRGRTIGGKFLITGGLGGLGLQTAKWLALQGVEHLILASRDTSKATLPDTRSILSEIEALGCQVTLEALDVSDYEMVEHLVETQIDLTGIVHAAGVLDDALLQNQDRQHFQNAIKAKVLGAWNLHRAVGHRNLTHFILYGSVAGILGSPGQANYAAANSFLSGLAAHRTGLGRRSLCVNWGPFHNLGMTASDDRQLYPRLMSRGITPLNTASAFDLLRKLMIGEQGAITVCDVNWNVVAREMGDSFPPYLSELSRDHVISGNFGLLDRLKLCAPDDQLSATLTLISGELVMVMGLSSDADLDINRGFFESGMDSLMAVELRNRLESGFGCSLPPTVAFEHPTAQKLSEMLLERLRHDGCLPATVQSVKRTEIELSQDQLDGLSDDEISELLRAEIHSLRTLL